MAILTVDVGASERVRQVNDDLAAVVEYTLQSLVQITNGQQGVGAGTIWHSEGLVITNSHVIHSTTPRVTLSDGRSFPAQVLAEDAHLDLAALAIEASGLPTIELGDSKKLRPGEWVTALGHPWGVKGAATGGIVIGMGSDLPEMPRPGREWLVVSLHMRPGHSGGPLIDVQGRLVGINTMINGPDIGVAVPVHVVKNFLRQRLS
jgi:serine protease Do